MLESLHAAGALSKLIYPVDKRTSRRCRLLHFLALAVVVARLVPHDWRRLMSPLMIALILGGENSLAIYCLDVLLAFVAHVLPIRISGGIAILPNVSGSAFAARWPGRFGLAWSARLNPIDRAIVRGARSDPEGHTGKPVC